MSKFDSSMFDSYLPYAVSVADNNSETCRLVNASSKFISFGYGGIPENILLNVLGWLLLLLMFAMLRKRAWDYGRIALVQKQEEQWTQIFYGRMDDLVGLSTDTASVSSTESNSIYADKGFCSWLGATFRIRDEHILQKCGPDAVQYLSFQKHTIVFMIVVMVISLCVVLPINFQGSLEGDETSFGHTTLNNLDPSSPYLWVHVTLSILFLPLGIIIMRRFSVSMKFEDRDMNASRTLMITNIPRKMCDKNDLQRHFREAYPEMEVQDIQLAYDINKVSSIDKEREKAFQARLYCENHFRNTGERLDMRPYACGNVCFCCDMFGCPKVDAIDYYTEEEERLTGLVEEERAAALRRPLGIAFVTFSSFDEARRVRQDHRIRCQCAGTPPASSVSHMLEPHRWRSPIVSEFLPTLLLWTAAALLPALVSYSDQWMSHWTKSKQNHTIMRKCLLFLLFMVLILPSLGLTSAQAFVMWAVHPKNQSYRWECLFLPDKGAFFVNYVITSAFIGTGLELIRFPELFVYTIHLSLARSRAETASVKKALLWGFPYGVQYAWMLLIFAMTTMYSLSCPLITPFGLLYMAMKHFVDKYNIYFVYGPSKINKQIHATAINAVIISIVLLQISFATLSVLRRLNDITIFALVGLTLTLITLFSHIFLNWCKGFSPISYQSTRSHQSPELPSPSREHMDGQNGAVGSPTHSQFVPQVLLGGNSGTPSVSPANPSTPSGGPNNYGTQGDKESIKVSSSDQVVDIHYEGSEA
ncbi:hypothetical protein J437_LFUL007351 [Ladona fulva]|uniref:CSC1-like protein 2 n=1 Tax=Ladona fulva TaxID=123851 RepID=A0A8K0KHT0_LADFU|nr:hypothetical protein J437_LFUL007351 [Ladona fulva]